MAKVTGEGSIIQLEKDKPRSKCRKWQLRVPVGLDPRTGKYKTRTRRFEGTYTQAKAALREFIDEIEGDRVQGRTGATFAEYCKSYLDARVARGEIAENTRERIESQLRSACRHIGVVRMTAVTPDMLDEMYASMIGGDTLSGRPASGTSVNQTHRVIHTMFEAAKREGLVTENPCDKANPPRVDTRPKKAIDPARAHEFIASLNPADPHELALMLAVTMGLRRGEVCGLSWGDVDLDRRIVEVRHSLDKRGNLGPTKTKAGMRMLPLSEVTRDALAKAKDCQEEEMGRRRADDPIVTTGDGGRMNPAVLGRWWERNREGYGLAEFTLHELRHTYLTLLAESGVHPKVMQELAGHSSSRVTMDIYTHVNMTAKRDAVAAVSKIF